MADMINLKPELVLSKAQNMREIQEQIQTTFKFEHLLFGANASVQSSGSATESLQQLNNELALVAAKLNTLISATSNYLERVVETLVDADSVNI